MLLKRGMRIDFVHFHSVPQTDSGSLEKVEGLVRILNRFQPGARVAMVPLLPVQQEIIERCPPMYRVLLYRRFMVRIAERLAYRLKGKALVTGESLGQVASQTVENLAAVEAAAQMPILRPLVGLDKQEIIDLARRIGSFSTSVLPHDDCCALHLPERPATRSSAIELDAAEAALDVEALVARTARATEITRIEAAAPWGEIPVPPQARSRSIRPQGPSPA
jgi:thiamine biosynthesis protein ThiI